MTDQVIATFMRFPALLAGHPEIARRADRASIVLLLEAGSQGVRLQLEKGQADVLPAEGPMRGWDIALRAAPEAWADHWQAVPAPDAFDILGMVRHGRMRIEGNFAPLMRHLQVVKDILALPRAAA
ncbi:hypothetical protein RM543_11570 [Roseicyclus sp. F158]|uniref:SCP2 domain-containing protein n=1 Tax=Tropicimonas omnivorans TaxID=3075590 RepID=A0ABU3DI07_9RHOB|nr:hypothetical protein [Roseicyclus sp. F158]MDT0683327.1 hypothetical protein [Roseicyclus sp. F158]